MNSVRDRPHRTGLPHSEITGSKFARNSPENIAACYVLHRLSVPRHSPNALRRLIRSPNRNAEANRPLPSRSTNGILSTSSLPAQAITREEILPAKDPAKGRPHKPIHNVKEQRTEDGEQRTEERRPCSALVQKLFLSGTAQPWWS